MYNTWTEITHRDLIQKGGSFKDLKELKVEKVVLKMSLTKKDGGMVYEKKSSTGKKGSKKKVVLGKDSEEKKRLQAESSNEHIASLTLLSLLAILSGQRPALTYARKSIANWKIRKGQLLGCKVSLRGPAALAFLDKTIRFHNLNQPDLSKGYSEDVIALKAQELGNLSLGINSLHLYPELDSLWIQIAAIFGHQNLGLDLALAFKNTKKLKSSILAKRGNSLSSKTLFKDNSKKGNSRQRLSDLVTLRKLYLTSLGLVVKI